MQVLILISKKQTSIKILDYFKRLIIVLLKIGEPIIYLYAKDNNYFKNLECKNFSLINNSKLNLNKNWDIVVLHSWGNETNEYSLYDFLGNIPKVSICLSDNFDDRLYSIPKLYKIISLYNNINIQEWGFPQELLVYSYPIFNENYNEITSKTDKKFNILYLHNESDSKFKVLKSALCVLNRRLTDKVNIIDYEHRIIIDDIFNSHISLLRKQEEIKTAIQNSNLVIGSGTEAYKYLCLGKPFIVAGVRGFGGIVNPGNYEKFKETNFEGRIGAELYEEIPFSILNDEIDFICKMNKSQLNRMIKNNKQLAQKDCNQKINAKNIESIFRDVILLNSKIYDDDEIMSLKPKLASNIIARNLVGSSEYFLIWMPFGNLLAKINNSLLDILNQINGKNSIINILNKLKINNPNDIKEFIEILRGLFDKKVIVFFQ